MIQRRCMTETGSFAHSPQISEVQTAPYRRASPPKVPRWIMKAYNHDSCTVSVSILDSREQYNAHYRSEIQKTHGKYQDCTSCRANGPRACIDNELQSLSCLRT